MAKKQCDTGGRKKEFFGGYLAKYMFLKRCRSNRFDPFFEFLRLAGTSYDATKEQDDVDYESIPSDSESENEQSEFTDIC